MLYLFLALAFIFNLFEFSAAILEKGLLRLQWRVIHPVRSVFHLQAAVVEKPDNSIQWIGHNPENKNMLYVNVSEDFRIHFTLMCRKCSYFRLCKQIQKSLQRLNLKVVSDLSTRYSCPVFEQLGSGV